MASAAVPAAATDLTYDLTSLGGDEYQYRYTVTNDGSLGPSTPIQLFDIDFDPLLYDETSLTLATLSPLNQKWSESFLSSAPGVPADYDVLALGPGIAPGTSVAGFTVDFKWLGAGLPGAQHYSISDPTSFATLGDGFTVSAVPEPALVSLLAAGLVALFAVRTRRRAI